MKIGTPVVYLDLDGTVICHTKTFSEEYAQSDGNLVIHLQGRPQAVPYFRVYEDPRHTAAVSFYKMNGHSIPVTIHNEAQ